jgi:hypothetical protein
MAMGMEAAQAQGLHARDARVDVIVALAAKFVSFATIMFAKLITKTLAASYGNIFPIAARSNPAVRREPALNISAV